MYGSEVTGMFKTNTVACSREGDFLLQLNYLNNYLDRSHIKYLKYTLGVNKKATNLAVMAEVGRYPLFFSIVITLIKYWFRLEKLNEGLLYDAYICNKTMYQNHTDCWYSSIVYILEKLGIQSHDVEYTTLINNVKKKLCDSYINFWNKKRSSISQSKLDTYFKFKVNYCFETYLLIENFNIRRTICKLRISAHDLQIERKRYDKNKTERSERKCLNCSLDKVEDETHFLIECPKYKEQRDILFKDISALCPNFINLSNDDKFIWLTSNEDLFILKSLGKFIIKGFELRQN